MIPDITAPSTVPPTYTAHSSQGGTIIIIEFMQQSLSEIIEGANYRDAL